jgi:hypothetical protein
MVLGSDLEENIHVASLYVWICISRGHHYGIREPGLGILVSGEVGLRLNHEWAFPACSKDTENFAILQNLENSEILQTEGF